MPGEFEFINWIAAQQRSLPNVSIGVGDDLAALKWADDLLLIGVDQVLDGVHFDSAIHSPRSIGRKAVNRNLSDCAAMGCLPAAMVATVALPPQYSLDQAKELYIGMKEAGDAFGCPIIGGDTASWSGKLVVTVTILGRAKGVKPVTRGGARVGDGIFVSGALGGSILGRHLSFEPRVELGRKLAPLVTSMIDLSDGISRDLPHICRASGVGAVIEVSKIPVHTDTIELSRRDGKPALEHALHDGEDYELLFTAPVEIAGGIRIGSIVADQGVWILDPDGNKRALEPRGWEHRLGRG